MDTYTIVRLLKNSGFRVLGHDSAYLYIEDPSCVVRSFETFVNYAWIILSVLTAFLIAGWAISMIRGAKNNIVMNMRNLALIFFALAMVKPIVNIIWGGDLFGLGCNTLKIPAQDVNKILDLRKLRMSRPSDDLYEEFDIQDSGVAYTLNTPMHTDAPDGSAMPAYAGSQSDDAYEYSTNNTLNTAGPAHAMAQGYDVIYVNPDGTRIRRSGGSRAWRNQNPGNMRYTDFTRKMGAIGQAGGFAVFPDEQTGKQAIRRLFRGETYRNLTIADAISRYAPPYENDTAAYHQKIKKLTGLDINRRVYSLNDDELQIMANAIQQIEGWTIGRTTQI